MALLPIIKKMLLEASVLRELLISNGLTMGVYIWVSQAVVRARENI